MCTISSVVVTWQQGRRNSGRVGGEVKRLLRAMETQIKKRYQLCLILLNSNVDLKIINETMENLFKFHLDIPWNYLWFCCEKDTFALLPALWMVRGEMSPISGVPTYRYQQSLSRCITCQDVCVQKSHAAKRLIS